MASGFKKNVFLVVCVPGQAVEILEIARLLNASDVFFPIIYFNLGNINRTPLMVDILAQGIDILDYNLGYIPSNQVEENQPDSTKSALAKKELPKAKAIKNRIKTKHPLLFSFVKWVVGTYYGLVSIFLHEFSFIHYILGKIERMKKETFLIRTYNVQLLILAEDSEGYFTPQLIRVAQKNRVKAVVFPYTFANQFEFLEDAFFNKQWANASFLSSCAGRFFTKWTRNYKGKKLLRWRPEIIFAAELFGQSAPSPWVMNSGSANVIAVESQFMKKYYLAAGIPEKQMQETGFVSLDVLSTVLKNRNAIRREMSQRYQLNLEKPWLVCAVPPSQWPRTGVGFSSYDHFLNEFVSFLKSYPDIEVILKFHPRLSQTESRQLCQAFHLTHVESGTAQLIGVADFYLASVSATIRWALACGLPTINYDLYAYRYQDFTHACGLFSVEHFSEFKILFNQVHDEVVRAFARKEITVAQPEFGRLDGKSGERILSLFRRLTDTP
jgi:hypothetical protein